MKLLTPDWLELSASKSVDPCDDMPLFETVYCDRNLSNINNVDPITLVNDKTNNNDNSDKENSAVNEIRRNEKQKEPIKNMDLLIFGKFEYWKKPGVKLENSLTTENSLSCSESELSKTEKSEDIQNDDSLQKKRKRFESGLASDESILRSNQDYNSLSRNDLSTEELNCCKNDDCDNINYKNKTKELSLLRCFKNQRRHKISDEIASIKVQTECKHFYNNICLIIY